MDIAYTLTLTALDDDALLTVEQLADHCSTTRNTVYDWIKHGRAPVSCRPTGGRLYFRAADVRDWIQAGREVGA